MALTVSVVSATEEIFQGEATLVVARTTEGEIGILPGHEPMLAILGAGEVRVTLENGEKISANTEQGFLSVENDFVTIVAGNASLSG